MSEDWQPTASLNNLRTRSTLLDTIRAFFKRRNVLEVDTPLLSHGTVTDVYLSAFSCLFEHSETGKPETLFLQTSPEYAMKRLLCGGSGPIFQICKAFRHEGAGRFHNPEFTMLEWYRPGFDHHALMAEVDALLIATLDTPPAEKASYQALFIQLLDIDPLVATVDQLRQTMMNKGIEMVGGLPDDKDILLQLLFSTVIEPVIGQQRPCLVYGFPASQAALARVNEQDPRTADRFEAYFKGIELANGFYELADGKEQRARFARDNAKRAQLGLPQLPIDERFLASLQHGLPECSGVALGIDRLLMLKLGADSITDVLTFPVSRA